MMCKILPATPFSLTKIKEKIRLHKISTYFIINARLSSFLYIGSSRVLFLFRVGCFNNEGKGYDYGRKTLGPITLSFFSSSSANLSRLSLKDYGFSL